MAAGRIKSPKMVDNMFTSLRKNKISYGWLRCN
jgi:hypothetical protein